MKASARQTEAAFALNRSENFVDATRANLETTSDSGSQRGCGLVDRCQAKAASVWRALASMPQVASSDAYI